MADTSTVLIVDAEAPRRKTLEQRIREAGMDVQPAGDFKAGQAALERRPAAVVCAASPGLNEALEFCADVRSRPDFEKTPLFVVAEREEEILRLRFLESGADEVVNQDALLQILPLRLPTPSTRRKRRELEERQVATTNGTTTTLGEATQSQMYFRLGPGELANALQFLSTTRRSGELRIEIRSPESGGSGLRGRIFLNEGKLVHAVCGEETGINALALLINMQNVEARFYEGITAEESSLAGGTDHILIQASVLSDELRALQNDVPEDAVYAQNQDITPPDDLAEPARSLLARVDGVTTVGDLIKTAAVSPVQGMMIFKELRDRDLIRAVPPEIAARNLARRNLQALITELDDAVNSIADSAAALAFVQEVERALRPLLSNKEKRAKR